MSDLTLNKQPSEAESGNDDSIWEYEYSATETETFHVILDLPLPETSRRSRRKSKRARPVPAEDSASPNPPGPDGPDDPDDRAAKDPSHTSTPLSRNDRVQILDLSSRNPFVSYRNRVYECTWATSLGTDLIFSSSDSLPSIPPLLAHEDFQLVTATRLKLVGQQVDLLPRKEPNTAANHPETLNNPNSELDTFARDLSPTRSGQQNVHTPTRNSNILPPEIAIPQAAADMSLASQQQARFLARIAAAKLKRGETDKVFLGKGRRLESVTWTSQGTGDVCALEQAHNEQLAAAAVIDEQAPSRSNARTSANADPAPVPASTPEQQASFEASSTAKPATIPAFPSQVRGASAGRPLRRGRPRGQLSGHTKGRVTGMGGLFRDYVPLVAERSEQDIDAGDASQSRPAGTALEATDERAAPQVHDFDSTPTSWDALIGAGGPAGDGMET